MGFNRYLEKKIAIILRKKGKSYQEIKEILHVSKDTLSRWLRDVQLSPQQGKNLEKRRINGGLKGSILGAKKLQNEKVRRTLDLYAIGMEQVGDLLERDLFIAGVALYASEGTKTDRVFEFTNSDPEMILFMCKWIRTVTSVNESQLRGVIWLHEELDESKAKNYWSMLTGIPLNQFYKTYIVKRKTENIRKQLHEYGIFSLRYLDSSFSRRTIGWIAGLLGSTWYNNRIDKLHLININPL